MRTPIRRSRSSTTCGPLLPEIESFFTHYAGLNGKRLRIVRRSGPRRARRLLKAGAKAFKARR